VLQRIDTEIDNASAATEVFDNIAHFPWQSEHAKIAVITDENQLPVKAVLKFLRHVRASTGAKSEILVLLLSGERKSEEIYRVWKRFLQRTGDPYLNIQAVSQGAASSP